MTEDSGAFKTNLRIRARFRHNIMIPACVAGMPHRSKKHRRRPLGPTIFNDRASDVASILKST
jgi:hypothetical protein